MEVAFDKVLSTWNEFLSWEILWGDRKQTQKSIWNLFGESPKRLPSVVLDHVKQENLFDVDALAREVEEFIREVLDKDGITFSVSINGTHHYPERLLAAQYAPAIFYYQGDANLLDEKCISVVGTRNSTKEGRLRARKLATGLAKEGWTIVSGLAKGIDSAAMNAALDAKGRTVGVIGTPINKTYPRENADLQRTVAREHLLISQVPFYRYANLPFRAQKQYFPQRNTVMSALSKATVIVEAGESGGTLIQAKECMKQGRPLFILNSCFESGMKWPYEYESRGAIRVRELDDVVLALEEAGGDDAGHAMEDD